MAVAERENKADMIKEWYNGYVFGSSYVYCPWVLLTIYLLSALRKRPDAKPKNYWKNTSHNRILLRVVFYRDNVIFWSDGNTQEYLYEFRDYKDELTYYGEKISWK